MADKYSTIQQHQPLRVPQSFDKQGRALIVQLDEIFDDIYKKFGRLRLEDFGEKFQTEYKDNLGNVAQLTIDLSGIQTEVASKIAKTETLQTADAIVSSAKAYTDGQLTNYSTTTQTATAISTYVATALGDYSTTQQTASAISTAIGNALGSYSTITQTADAIAAAVADCYGHVSNITIDADGISMSGKSIIMSGGHIILSGGYIDLDSGYINVGKFGMGTYTDSYSGNTFTGIFSFDNGNNMTFMKDTWENYSSISFYRVTPSDTSGVEMHLVKSPTNTSGFQTREPSIMFSTVGDSSYGMIGSNAQKIREVHATSLYGTVQTSSSRKLKKRIRKLPDMGSKIDLLEPVSFEYKDSPGYTHYGLIAEDAQKVLPVLCGMDKDSISYVELFSVFIKEIQSLRKRVAKLEGLYV